MPLVCTDCQNLVQPLVQPTCLRFCTVLASRSGVAVIGAGSTLALVVLRQVAERKLWQRVQDTMYVENSWISVDVHREVDRTVP